MALNADEVLEKDARILYDLTISIIMFQGVEAKRNEVLAQKHVDAMLRRHGSATTQRVMEAVRGRIEEIASKAKTS